MFDLIVAASGESARFGAEKNKLLTNPNEYTVLENSIRPFLAFDGLNRVILAVSQSIFNDVSALCAKLSDKITVCLGGASRTETVKKALTLVTAENVLIHDGARPFVTAEIITDVLDALKTHGAAVPLIAISDSITDISHGYTPVNRDCYRAVQTPQGFRSELIKKAYDAPDGTFTDDISVYLTKFDDVAQVNGSKSNKKITSTEDMLVANCRIGVGYDTHRLMRGRKLILGNVNIPHDKGLLGHSDADVLTHAVMDAILSALGRRDIGFYFPDTSDEYENIDSFILLNRVKKMLEADGYAMHNLSATILAEKPKLASYIPLIINNFSKALELDCSDVGILATTAEGVGDIGREEAVSAIATVTIIKQ